MCARLDSGEGDRRESFLRLHVLVEAGDAAAEVVATVWLTEAGAAPTFTGTTAAVVVGALDVEDALLAAGEDEAAATDLELVAEGAFELEPDEPEPPADWPEREPVTASVNRVAPLGQKVIRRPTLLL